MRRGRFGFGFGGGGQRRRRRGREDRRGFGFVRDSFGSCSGCLFLLTLLLEAGFGDGEEERAV